MAIPTFAPPVGPSPGTAFKPQIKVLEAEFGDGYNQPTPDGINNIREVVDLQWDGLTEIQMHQIHDFLITRRGSEPFWFRPAGFTSPLKWTCKEWSRVLADGVWKVQAQLKQSFAA